MKGRTTRLALHAATAALTIACLLGPARKTDAATANAQSPSRLSSEVAISWHRITGDHTAVVHDLPGSERAHRLLALAVRTRQEIASELGITTQEPLVIYVCKSETSFTRASGKEVLNDQVGVATPGSHRIVVLAFRGGRPTPLRETIIHEIAHIELADAADGELPFWFQEGFALYQSHQLTIPEAFYLALAGVAGRLLPLSEIDQEFPYGMRLSRLAYAQSLDAFTYLTARIGLGGIAELARNVRRHGSFSLAFRQVYQAGVREFENGWRASLTRRYRWVLFTSCWIPILLLVTVAAGLMKWRRAKKTLARWEAQEQEHGAAHQQTVV